MLEKTAYLTLGAGMRAILVYDLFHTGRSSVRAATLKTPPSRLLHPAFAVQSGPHMDGTMSPANTLLSIIVPVLDEALLINRTIRHVRRFAGYREIEIIVVDGHPAGHTLRSIADADVTKVISAEGRGYQMNAGARIARGSLLLFLHADTRLPRRAALIIRDTLCQGDAVAGAFSLGIASRRPIFRWIETIANVRSRISRIPYGDQAIFARTDYFHRIGGFRHIPIMEDVDLMRRIKRDGRNIAIVPSKVQTSPRRWEKEGIVYGTLRNWTLMALFLMGVSPRRLKKFYP